MTAPCGDVTTGRLPVRQARRCRRRFRTTTIGRTRTPSIGSCPCLAARAGSTSLVVHARGLTPHPVARCEPRLRTGPKPHLAARLRRPPRQGLAGRLELPRARRRPGCRFRHQGPRLAARKMRLTDFCNRLHSRAPPDCPIPGALPRRARLATATTRVPAHPGCRSRRPRGGRSGCLPIRVPNEPSRRSFA